MSRWSDEFVEQYGGTGTVRRLTNDIKDAINKDKRQNEIDRTLTEVLKAKFKRRGY